MILAPELAPDPVPNGVANGSERARARAGIGPAVGIGLPLVLGLVHVALIAPLYHVGSFDDDASYILAAKALLAGHGLTGHLASGEAVVGLYPPGYSALIAPLVWLWPHSFLPERLLSVACYAALFPLTWALLGRRNAAERLRIAALVLLALGPPLATFAGMVMAETPFLVVLLLLLLALDRWVAQARVVTPAAAATVALAGALIWIKQAGIGIVAGLVLWLLIARTAGPGRWARRLGRAGLVVGGVAAMLAPVLVARASAGIPMAGSRYSGELGAYYRGGLVDRLVHVLPGSTWHLLSAAVPATLVPYLEPLPLSGHWPDVWKVLSWLVTVLVVVGGLTWASRYRDAAVLMVLVYLGESVLWPFVNERRAVLVVPLLTIWYIFGAATLWRLAGRAAAGLRNRWPRRVGALVAVFAVLGPLVVQMPRDYLFPWGRSSSQPEGSRYMGLLKAMVPPGAVIETDYRSTTALLTGHPTAWNAFTLTEGLCYLPGVLQALQADDAGFLLTGNLNKPGVIDDPCLEQVATDGEWAVRLLRSGRDDASVFELIGPGTGHPDLANLLSGASWNSSDIRSGAAAAEQWTLPAARAVSQVSVGEVSAWNLPTRWVRVELRRPDGSWFEAASARGPVGDKSPTPYLLASFDRPVQVTALRILVAGAAPGVLPDINDVNLLGPASTTTRS